MRESRIENYFKKKFEDAGYLVRKVKWIGHRGAPDRVVIGYGVCAFVELKAPGKKLAAHQEREHKRMKSKKAYVFTVDSIAGVNSLFDMIEELGWLKLHRPVK